MRAVLIFAMTIGAAIFAEEPAQPLALEKRLSEEHLRAVHEDRERFIRERKTDHILKDGIFEDRRVALNVRADATTLPQVLEAAKKANVSVIVFNGKAPAKTDAGDPLFMSCSEDGAGKLDIASSGPAILSRKLCFQPLNDRPIAADCRGFQICGCGGLDNKFMLEAFLVGVFNKYPDEFLGAADAPTDLTAWDRAAAQRSCCCVANNAAVFPAQSPAPIADCYALSFTQVSTHVLVHEFNEKEVRAALMNGRSYMAHDWLADPTGFNFGAANLLGTFFMGDSLPYYVGTTKLGIFSPVPAHIKIIHGGKVVKEADGNQLVYDTSEFGAFRTELWLRVDGELRPWIYSNPVYLLERSYASLEALKLPMNPQWSNVVVKNNVTYVAGRKEDEPKHELDIYQPKDKKNAPVLMFIHGGSWRTGDRSQYPHLGNMLAEKGILTFIPSYRLVPAAKFPAQAEDAAAAFKWVVDHAAEYGGDPERVYVGGHSAGGHIAALITYAPQFLAAQNLSAQKIKGLICISGVYDLAAIGDNHAKTFPTDEIRKQGSPLLYVKSPGPRTLITCCEHDYLSLPQQAKDFYKAIKAAGTDAEFLFVPEQNHISEMLNITDPNDLTANAVLKFIR
ncbi:MAG TPA: alpha/beta hydrolase [Planctomycetota bacterium]|nr:alpha/beta hydrolase [Planctomycetota bacterium]